MPGIAARAALTLPQPEQNPNSSPENEQAGDDQYTERPDNCRFRRADDNGPTSVDSGAYPLATQNLFPPFQMGRQGIEIQNPLANLARPAKTENGERIPAFRFTPKNRVT